MNRALRYFSSATARMAVTPPSKPLVAIVGATGTGKSDVGKRQFFAWFCELITVVSWRLN